MGPSSGRYAAAFAAGALAYLLVLYRFLSYAERNRLPGSTLLVFAGVCFVTGFFVTLGVTKSRYRLATCLLAGSCAAQVAIILLDWRQDPTNHNLLPFELAFLCLTASPAYFGAACSGVFRRS